MGLFPMFLKLEGRPCLVVGAGRLGEEKTQSLLSAGAKVRVVAPQAMPGVVEWASAGRITWDARPYASADLDGVFMVIAATSSVEVNDQVYQEARRRGVLCNVVDDPPRCAGV